MPRLQVPRPSGENRQVQLSPEGVAAKVASGAKIGQVMQQQATQATLSNIKFGDIKQKFGEWTYEKFKDQQRKQQQFLNQQQRLQQQRNNNALMDAIYNTADSNAVKDFNTKAADVMDAASAPVSNDADIHNKALLLTDPEQTSGAINNAATQTLSDYTSVLPSGVDQSQIAGSLEIARQNQLAKAESVTRAAQTDLTHKALTSAINNDIQSGLLDSPENLGFYSAKGLSRITKAVDSGVIGPQVAQGLAEDLRKGLYFGSLQAANQKNPLQIQQLLSSKNADELNLTAVEYKNLVKENLLALKDQRTLDRIQYQTSNEVSNIKSRLYESQLNDGIKEGSVHSAQIMEAYDKGKIGYDQLMRLATSYDKQEKKATTTSRSRNDISADILAGSVLSNYSSKQIDDHYENSLRSLSPTGRANDVPITNKVALAAQYKAPIKSLENEINYRLQSTNPKDIQEAVFMYSKLQQDNPIAVSGITNSKTVAYLSALSNAYKYSTSLDEAGIQRIKDSIYNVDGRTLTKRKNEFSEQITKGAFGSTKDIKTVIANMYDDGNPWYRGPDYVSDDTVKMIEPLLRDAYIQTGNIDDAIKTVTNQTKAIFGHSEVNDTEIRGLNSGSIMAFPPEQHLPNGVKATAEEIRASIQQEATPVLPEGVQPSQVKIGSDDATIEQARAGIQPSYYLYYTDSNGQEMILPGRWRFDNTSKGIIDAHRQNVASTNTDIPQKVALNAPMKNDVTENPIQAKIAETLRGTKGYNENPVLNDQLIESLSQASQVANIARHYPGDKAQQPIVEAALTKMIGKDEDPYRVSQSMQLVNSILANNASPETYIQYGKATTSPKQGDVVITKTSAGLYAGQRKVNGVNVISVVTSGDKGLQVNYIPERQIRGYRELPTPEAFARQKAPLEISDSAPRFNPLTGEVARAGQATDRFNPLTGEAFTANNKSSNKPLDLTVRAQESASSTNNSSAQNEAVQSNAIEQTKPAITPDNIIAQFNKNPTAQIDVGDGETKSGAEILAALNFGKQTSQPKEGDLVIANGQIGKYIDVDPTTNEIIMDVNGKQVKVKRTEISEYRVMPTGKDLEAFMKKFRLLSTGKKTLAQILKGENNG